MRKISHDTTPFPLIRASIWGVSIDRISKEDFDEMWNHSIAALPASVLSSGGMPIDLLQEWKKTIVSQVLSNANCRYAESMLPIKVPYIVLKGTSAAQYYPNPELRTLGDIDILVNPKDAEEACESLLRNGYLEMTSEDDAERGRHRAFKKYGVLVEVHFSFAIMNDPKMAKKFDALVFNGINESHVLPDLINGLVLIEHINQHLESGLGLRQVIDWMVFVDKCLTDETWKQFREYAVQTGMDTLAIVTTRMCEIYLGLSEHQWCQNADKRICAQLMEHVLTSGNFGHKKTMEEKKSFYRSPKFKHPFITFRELQQKGKKEWKKAKNPVLRQFAWLWKGTQFIGDIPFMVKNHWAIKKHKKMLEKLGVVIRNLE